MPLPSSRSSKPPDWARTRLSRIGAKSAMAGSSGRVPLGAVLGPVLRDGPRREVVDRQGLAGLVRRPVHRLLDEELGVQAVVVSAPSSGLVAGGPGGLLPGEVALELALVALDVAARQAEVLAG